MRVRTEQYVRKDIEFLIPILEDHIENLLRATASATARKIDINFKIYPIAQFCRDLVRTFRNQLSRGRAEPQQRIGPPRSIKNS